MNGDFCVLNATGHLGKNQWSALTCIFIFKFRFISFMFIWEYVCLGVCGYESLFKSTFKLVHRVMVCGMNYKRNLEQNDKDLFCCFHAVTQNT